MFPLQNVTKSILCLLCALLLCGCSIGINVDDMLTPPKLSSQQEQIYQALTDTTGSGIRLKYPKSGNYLSSFIIADIDGDSADEAIVFYQYTGVSPSEEGLRINVLDCIDGVWLSVCDRSAQGTEIEKVILSPLGSNDRMNVIIGCSMANQSVKNVSAYTYTDNSLELTFSQSYSLFDVTPSVQDGQPDLILAVPSLSGAPAYAAVYRLTEDGAYHEYKHLFQDSYTDYSQMIYGILPGGRIAVYIDAASGTSNLQTEILCMEEDGLVNLLERCGSSAQETVRRAGLMSMDIDRDGMPEIPVQTVFQGYEEAAETEQMMQTKWLAISGDLLYTEHLSYYSAVNSYVFLLPHTWETQATVRNNTAEDELQIVQYNGTLSEKDPVLLRIHIAYDQADLDEHLAAGYTLFRTKGTAYYLMRSEADAALPVTAGEILLSFCFLE